MEFCRGMVGNRLSIFCLIMAIRTLVAAAALVAFTTPTFAQSAEDIVLLDESVSTGGLFALGAGLSGAAIAGIVAAVVVVGGIIANSNDDDDSSISNTDTGATTR